MRVKFGVDAEIKKCPFCGKNPVFYFNPLVTNIEIVIKCRNRCAEQSEYVKEDYNNYNAINEACEKVIKKWNTREKE